MTLTLGEIAASTHVPCSVLAITLLLGWLLIRKILYYFVLLIIMVYVMRQVRKPTRWTGLFFAWIMNLSHSNVTDWGLAQVAIEQDFVILDVGCGGGRTIQKLAAIATQGKVFGVDYARGSVALSRLKNSQLIKAGRVEIREAPVSKLPFLDDKFDLVTAVETQYYWPDLSKDLQEIRRVLKPGGTLIVIAEAYKGGKRDVLQRPAMSILGASYLSVDEQRELFTTAGYTEVQITEERGKGWMCAIGRKAIRSTGGEVSHNA